MLPQGEPWPASATETTIPFSIFIKLLNFLFSSSTLFYHHSHTYTILSIY